MSELKRKFVSETARIHWRELERHFAQGALVTVDKSLDLVEVAERMAADDKAAFQRWLTEDQIRRSTTAEAKRWAAADTELWCVVVAPWALVQEA